MKTALLLRAPAWHRPGVLGRMTGMFYHRTLNIRTLTLGEKGEEGLVPIVVRVAGEGAEIERLPLSVGSLVRHRARRGRAFDAVSV